MTRSVEQVYDELLVLRARDGDEKAFAELVFVSRPDAHRRTADGLYLYVKRTPGARSAARAGTAP